MWRWATPSSCCRSWIPDGSAALPEVRPRPESGHAGPVRPIPRQPGRPRAAPGTRATSRGTATRSRTTLAAVGQLGAPRRPGGTSHIRAARTRRAESRSAVPRPAVPRATVSVLSRSADRAVSRPAVSGPGRLPVPGSVRGQPPVPLTTPSAPTALTGAGRRKTINRSTPGPIGSAGLPGPQARRTRPEVQRRQDVHGGLHGPAR